jgi:hypothetical protein
MVFPLIIALFTIQLNNLDTTSFCRVLKEEISYEYQGTCKRNLAHGTGIAKGIDYYEGQFQKGLPHGNGKYTWSNGDLYSGGWKRGKMHGIGEFTFAENDSTINGLWKNDKFIRIVDTTQKELPPYKIIYQRNLTRVRFVKTGSGNKVLYNLSDAAGNRRISSLNAFGTSGNYITYSRHFGYENVTFPFEGKISFMAPSNSGFVIYNIELFFVINEPGTWEIYLNF